MANEGGDKDPKEQTAVAEEKKDQPKKSTKKIRMRKLTTKQQQVLTSINRLSRPTPNFEFVQKYYLPQPIMNVTKKYETQMPEKKRFRLQDDKIPDRIIQNRPYFTMNLPEFNQEQQRIHTFVPDLNDKSLRIATKIKKIQLNQGVKFPKGFKSNDGSRPPSASIRMKRSVVHYRSGVFKLDPAVSSRTSQDLTLIQKLKNRTYSKEFCDENDYISSPMKLVNKFSSREQSAENMMTAASYATLNKKSRPQTAVMRSSFTSNFQPFSYDASKTCRNRNATHIIIGKKGSSQSIGGNMQAMIQPPILNVQSAMSMTQPRPLQFADGIDMPFIRKKNQLIKALKDENKELKEECDNLEKTTVRIEFLNNNIKKVIGDKAQQIKNMTREADSLEGQINEEPYNE